MYFKNVTYVGVTATLAIENMVKEAKEKRRAIFLVGASGKVEDRLRRLKVLRQVLLENQVHNRLEALQQGSNIINQHHSSSSSEVV